MQYSMCMDMSKYFDQLAALGKFIIKKNYANRCHKSVGMPPPKDVILFPLAYSSESLLAS